MKRYSTRYPAWHLKRLIWWAEGKGQSIAGIIQNIVQARIEANEDLIDRIAEDAAEAENLSPEEWKQKMLEKNNYNSGGERFDEE